MLIRPFRDLLQNFSSPSPVFHVKVKQTNKNSVLNKNKQTTKIYTLQYRSDFFLGLDER